MVDIFESMIVAGTKLIRKSLAELDSPLTIPWEANTAPTGTVKLRKRLQPENSEIKKEQFTQYSLQHIYNLIRARENPYPNAYIEDTTGRLYIRKVDFEPKT
jgi:methionyl-tRNA formyltransferase